MNNYNYKINLLQYEKGRILKNPAYHTLDDAIIINKFSLETSKDIWDGIGSCIKHNGDGIDSSLCPFCLGFYCSDCEYSGKSTICQKQHDSIVNIKKLSNTWYKETHKIINDCFK